MNNNENGIAIVFALGIVSLLFIIALGFITTAIIERKTEENFTSLTTARMTAESGLQRIIAGMKHNSLDVSKDFSNIYSRCSSYSQSSDEATESLISLLPTENNGITYYSLLDYTSSTDTPTWQYLPFDHDTNTPIIARFAYLSTPYRGKINPSTSVDSGRNAELSGVDAISEDFSISEATGVDINGNDVIGRPGRDISELFLTNLPNWFTNDMAKKISVTNANPSGQLDPGGRWADFNTLFTSLNITDDTIKTNFFNTLSLDSLPIQEAFWIDINSNNKKESNELYHRFNLTRTDWDLLNISDITSLPVSFFSTQGDGISWLSNWKSKGDMTSVESCKNQIIANLIDYNDTNNTPTTDYPGTNPPTYVGLEKTPYLNEIKLKFKGSIKQEFKAGKKNKPDKYKYTYNISLESAGVELVNMFDISEIDTITTISSLEVYYKCYPSLAEGIVSINLGKKKEREINNISVINYYTNEKSLGKKGIKIYKKKNKSEYLVPQEMKIEFRVTNLKIQLNNNTKSGKGKKETTDTSFLDYSYIVQNPSSIQYLLPFQTVNGNKKIEENLFFDAQVADPRQNLLENDWLINYSNHNNGTIDKKNSNFYPNPGGNTDSEPNAIEPWEISTVYIRNAPMLSPWELGFIHRGKAWQTINLKKYNSDDNIGVGGGGDYNNGDANILDQIKMTSDTKTHGKICINSNIEDVLKVLFEKINIGSDIGSPEGPGSLSGTELDSETANLLAQEVLDNNSTDDGSLFPTRAQLLRGTKGLTNALCYDVADGGIVTLGRTSDATQEEIIGKFINLTTANLPNIFTIIVVAQTIKDIGSPSSPDTITINNNGKNVNCQTGRYDIGGDEIISTQKILAIVRRDPLTDKFYIIDYEYID